MSHISQILKASRRPLRSVRIYTDLDIHRQSHIGTNILTRTTKGRGYSKMLLSIRVPSAYFGSSRYIPKALISGRS